VKLKVAALVSLALFGWGVAQAVKPSGEHKLERAQAEIERLDTALRLRTAELRVVRGQLAACEKRATP